MFILIITMDILKKYLPKIYGNQFMKLYIDNNTILSVILYLRNSNMYQKIRINSLSVKNGSTDKQFFKLDDMNKYPVINNLISSLKDITNLNEFLNILDIYKIIRIDTDAIIAYKFDKIIDTLHKEKIIERILCDEKFDGWSYLYKINNVNIAGTYDDVKRIYNKIYNNFVNNIYKKYFDDRVKYKHIGNREYVKGSLINYIEFTDIENDLIELYNKMYNKNTKIKQYNNITL